MLGIIYRAYCINDTNQDIASIYNREKLKATIFGPAKNNVQFGVEICSVGPASTDKFKVDTILYNASQTNVYGLWKLPHGYRLAMTLKTIEGEEIKKTSEGNSCCKKPGYFSIPYGTVTVLHPQVPESYDDLFDLRKSFNIKKPGNYILTIKPNLYALTGYQEYTNFDLPGASVEVNLAEFDIKQ